MARGDVHQAQLLDAFDWSATDWIDGVNNVQNSHDA
jgi:hypothetical protein